MERGRELFIDGENLSIDYNKIIGKGSSAIVYQGFIHGSSPISILQPCLETKTLSNCKAAVKIGNKFNKDEFEQIFREVDAAMKLGWHRHICCLLGWSVYKTGPVLLFEYIDGQDLHAWARSFADPDNLDLQLPEKEITQILWQISDGMEHISAAGIVHKDLAARNILLTSQLEAKITDFGLASECDESFTYESITPKRLPIRWMAPEALTTRIFSPATDIWSFGVLVWELFNKGNIPYGTLDGSEIISFLQAGSRLKLPENVSEGFVKIMAHCFNSKQEDRPDFKCLKFHFTLMLEKYTENYGYLEL